MRAIPDALILTGPVSEDVLVNLYRGASMLLYPSLYEGFGLPVLEAMRCGVPVIAANCASVPEIVGDAGVLLDPLDVSAWTNAIGRLLGDASMTARLRDAGIARAAEFSWARRRRTRSRCSAAARARPGGQDDDGHRDRSDIAVIVINFNTSARGPPLHRDRGSGPRRAARGRPSSSTTPRRTVEPPRCGTCREPR